MTRDVDPVVPIGAELGTTWEPAQPSSAGPMTEDLGEYGRGLILVEKICRECGRTFTGWITIASHERRILRLQRELVEATRQSDQARTDEITVLLEEPLKVGRFRMCDECVARTERAAEVASLATTIKQVQRRWQEARMLRDKVPAGRELRRQLRQLRDLMPAGGGFQKVQTQLTAIGDWLEEQRAEGDA